jgi:hypothetical protein
MIVTLTNGRQYEVDADRLSKRLRGATPAELADWRLTGRGIGVRWPQVDEDFEALYLVERGKLLQTG